MTAELAVENRAPMGEQTDMLPDEVTVGGIAEIVALRRRATTHDPRRRNPAELDALQAIRGACGSLAAWYYTQSVQMRINGLLVASGCDEVAVAARTILSGLVDVEMDYSDETITIDAKFGGDTVVCEFDVRFAVIGAVRITELNDTP